VIQEKSFAARFALRERIADAAMQYGSARFHQGAAIGTAEYKDKSAAAVKAFEELLALTLDLIVDTDGTKEVSK
jgi:hypothetical protein